GLHQRNRAGPSEAPRAVADIEDDALLAPVEHRLARPFSLRILLAAMAAIHVREDIARPQILHKQVLDRPARAQVAAEIDHHRNVSDVPSLNSLLVRSPLRPREVRALDSDDQALML